ncbi:MutS-related protein [Algoriphagus jejuensis]|uniref:MutS-related protein n=1 Tax=Algoriphagus jejuensis TaxID=419934 RepID=UPI0031CF296C
MANFSKIKKGNFYFNSIGKYFLKCEKTSAFQVISDKTYQDLDLDEVFMYIDRTLSKVGQQFLYHSFRTIPDNSERFDRFEHLIKVLNEHSELKEAVIKQLSKLNTNEAYYISSLFLEDHFQKPEWFFVVPLLSLISVISLSLSFFFPQFLLLLVPVLAVNYFIHYWNRESFVQYSGSILQLLTLNQVAKEFVKAEVLAEANQEITKSIQSIDGIGVRMSLFKLEAKIQSDVGQAVESLTDIIKALFLIEPIVFFNVLRKLDSKRNEIHRLYKLIGEIDVAISIDFLRKELPYYSVSTLTDKEKQLRAKDIYHPLLLDSVANSIDIHRKSVLLTGSNMSGKTTFIRTIGINVIMSQTLNTCFAREFAHPRLKVHSAIRIADDLMNDKSYYFEEVTTIKKMLEESRSGAQNLFLLDEMFKGTNTVERIAAGKSVLSYLNEENNIVFISSHDLELADYLSESYDLYHFTEIVENENILFDFKLKAGQLKTTNAIRILELNDYPLEIILEAQELSKQIKEEKNNKRIF